MAIQTKVACHITTRLRAVACDGETTQCIADIVILSPSQLTPMVKSSTILNPKFVIFLSARFRH